MNFPTSKRSFFIQVALFGTLVGSSLVACANDYSYDNSVYQFMEAERQKSSPNAMYQYEQNMQGSLFAVYPAYWRLNYNLDSQSPDTINNFVQKYPENVMSEKLAADYAETKAKSGDYSAVRAVAHSIENADASEACAIGLGYNGSGDMRALHQKSDVWLNTQIKQPLCEKLASEMVNNPRITQTDKHEQLIRMMRIDNRQLSSKKAPLNKMNDIVNLARSLNLAIDYGILSSIRNSPNAFFTQFANQPYSQTNQYLYVYAISLLANRSYWDASSQLNYDINQDKTRPRPLLSDMAKRYAWRSIAVKRMNMNTDDGFNIEAVNWFRNSLGEPFNQEEAEDYAQAAIYFSQWQDVVNAILAMNVENQSQKAWQYWLARGYEQTGKQHDAKNIYRQLATGIDYYGLLAKDRLGIALTAQDLGGSHLPNISQKDQQRVMQDPYFARAFLLIQNNANPEHIQREWNWAVRMANKKNDTTLILAAAKRAHDLGIYNRSIYAMENTLVLRAGAISHPMPYQSSVVGYSRGVGIDPAWAYGIMRQESRFQTNARSGVGAGGLMQIMPGTAKQIARGMGESAGNMSNPDTNIRYGTWFLKDLSDKSSSQIAVATAGYNAGPGAAKKWLPKHGSIAADQYVEAIPYSETRDYVKHVMENTTIYSVLMGHGMPISQRMGNVSPSW